MRRSLRVGFIAVLLALSAVAVTAQTIRVATYNLRNYLADDRIAHGIFYQSYPKPEAAKAAVRATIRAVSPDILALQEMGGPAQLTELQRDLEREGLSYPYAFVLRGPDEKRHLAVLSRVAWTETVGHTTLDFPYRGAREVVKRGLLEVVFAGEAGEPDWRLFICHLKSRYTDFEDDPQSAARRHGEARAIRELLRRRADAGQDIFLLAGDLNSTQDDRPWARLTKIGARELTRPVPAADSRGHVWTYFYPKQATYERVDAFLASPALWPAINGGRGFIADGPESAIASDHRMVYLDLTLGRLPTD